MKKSANPVLNEPAQRAASTMSPAVATTKTVRSPVDRLRTRVSDESKMVDGLYPITALTGSDAIPNAVSSTPPEPMMMKPTELWVDRDNYQRSHTSRKSIKLIIQIIENWDWTKYKSPVVTRDAKGRYVIIDGQHTSVAAASHPDIERIPVMYVRLESLSDQAKAFIGHNMDRVNVSQLDLWYARITGRDPWVVQADAILRQHGVSVVRNITSDRSQSWESNQTMSTKRLLDILRKHGAAKFSEVVDFLSKCNYTQIRGDHWKWAEEYLTSAERNSLYQPSLMIDIVRSINEHDAFMEAKKIANSMDLKTYQGYDVFYKRRYQKAYQLTI